MVEIKEIPEKIDFKKKYRNKKIYFDSSRLKPLKTIEILLSEEQSSKERIDKKIKNLKKIKKENDNEEDAKKNDLKLKKLEKKKKNLEILLKKLRHERRLIFLEMLWKCDIDFEKFSTLIKNGTENVMKGELIEEIRKKQ